MRRVCVFCGASSGRLPEYAAAIGRQNELEPYRRKLSFVWWRLGNDGYSFANVNPVPDLDREKRVAGFTFFVDPGRRVYVRRVNISGNQKTLSILIARFILKK